jgi:hypothetical protein
MPPKATPPPGKILNPATNRYVKIDGKIGQSIVNASGSKKSKTTKVTKTTKATKVAIKPIISLKKMETILNQVIKSEIKNIKKNNGLSIEKLEITMDSKHYFEIYFRGIDPYASEYSYTSKVEKEGNYLQISMMNERNVLVVDDLIPFSKFKSLEDNLSKKKIDLVRKVLSNVSKVEVEWAQNLHDSGPPGYKEKNKYALELKNKF